MDELEKLFTSIVEENKDKISKTLKECVLREICIACYDILLQKAENNQEMSSNNLYDEVVKLMEKDDT